MLFEAPWPDDSWNHAGETGDMAGTTELLSPHDQAPGEYEKQIIRS